MKKTLINKILTITVLGTILAGGLSGCGTANASENNNTVSTQEKTVSESTDTEAGEETEQVAADSSDQVTVRLGLLSGHVLPVIAQEEGFFDEEGVSVELYTFNAGAPEVEAYTAGELDIIETGDLPFFNAILNGVDLKAIGSYSNSTQVDGIVVRDDAGITTFADLKGKRVSVPLGSNIQSLLYEYLEAGGLTDEDVEILGLVGNDAVNALVNGDIDAAVLWEPYVTFAEKNDGITKLADTSDFRSFVCPISSSTTFIEEHNVEVLGVLRALNKAAKWSDENKEAAAQEVADYFGIDDIESILINLDTSDRSVPLTQEKIDAIKLGEEKNYKYGIIETEIDVDAYIDDQFTDLLD